MKNKKKKAVIVLGLLALLGAVRIGFDGFNLVASGEAKANNETHATKTITATDDADPEVARTDESSREPTLSSSANPPARVRILTFSLDADGLSHQSSQSTPGAIKKQRRIAAGGSLYYRLLSQEGTVIWEAAISDPRRLYLCHLLDEQDPHGELTGGVMIEESAPLVIRYPEHLSPHSLELYDFTQSSSDVALSQANQLGTYTFSYDK